MKVFCVFGTRPEAIKMAPVIKEMQKHKFFEVITCATAQHREMLDQVLNLFDIKPDIDLNIMKPNQALSELTSNVISKIDKLLGEIQPDLVMIQGDTTTVMATGLSAFYRKIPVAHIEAGLRSYNIYSPFPEELNRRIISLFAEYNFAPTKRAVQNLIAENVPEEKIYLVGNTVIDALLYILKKPVPEYVKELQSRINGKKLILVTAHRRENFGERLENICYGIKKLVKRNDDIVVIYPVHLNPNVREPVFKILGNQDRVFLIDPVEYDILVHLMNQSYLILTDSGGIQEEAPSLGKPVLVMRTETERPEGIDAGTAKLVGPFEDKIIENVELLLYNQEEYNKMAKAVDLYGDGNASKRIVEILKKSLKN